MTFLVQENKKERKVAIYTALEQAIDKERNKFQSESENVFFKRIVTTSSIGSQEQIFRKFRSLLTEKD